MDIQFAKITRADAALRQVDAAIDETPDHSGEIFDYATSRPYFEAWSAAAKAASDGKSLGNVRAMHGRVAAGVLRKIDFDNAAKQIRFTAKIVDDAEWAKVESGVYTGISPGGKYIKKWSEPGDAGAMRYTAEPVEISLVDKPCIPSATFTMIKLDGEAEQRAFAPPPVEAKPTGEAALAKLLGLDGDETVEAAVSKLLSERGCLRKRVGELEGALAKANLRSAGKLVEGAEMVDGTPLAVRAAELDALAPERRSLELIKIAQQNPHRVV